MDIKSTAWSSEKATLKNISFIIGKTGTFKTSTAVMFAKYLGEGTVMVFADTSEKDRFKEDLESNGIKCLSKRDDDPINPKKILDLVENEAKNGNKYIIFDEINSMVPVEDYKRTIEALNEVAEVHGSKLIIVEHEAMIKFLGLEKDDENIFEVE